MSPRRNWFKQRTDGSDKISEGFMTNAPLPRMILAFQNGATLEETILLAEVSSDRTPRKIL